MCVKLGCGRPPPTRYTQHSLLTKRWCTPAKHPRQERRWHAFATQQVVQQSYLREVGLQLYELKSFLEDVNQCPRRHRCRLQVGPAGFRFVVKHKGRVCETWWKTQSTSTLTRFKRLSRKHDLPQQHTAAANIVARVRQTCS